MKRECGCEIVCVPRQFGDRDYTFVKIPCDRHAQHELYTAVLMIAALLIGILYLAFVVGNST